MTDTAAPAPSPWFDILKASIPYIGQALLVVITAILTTLTAQHLTTPKPHLVIDAADKPKPGPIDAMTPYNDVIREYCGGVNGTLATILGRLPEPRRVAPAK